MRHQRWCFTSMVARFRRRSRLLIVSTAARGAMSCARAGSMCGALISWVSVRPTRTRKWQSRQIGMPRWDRPPQPAGRSSVPCASSAHITTVPRISIIAHSWGSIAAGRFAGTHPDLVDRLVFFGPVTWRSPTVEPQRYPAWRLVSLDDQWKRFTDDVPNGESPVLARRHFDEWGSTATSTPIQRAAHVRPPA